MLHAVRMIAEGAQGMQYLTHDVPHSPRSPYSSEAIIRAQSILWGLYSRQGRNGLRDSLSARLIHFNRLNPTNALPYERMRLDFFQGLAADTRVRVHSSLVFSTSAGR